MDFLDKVKDDDVLTANALDGMLKAQEAGALKPAKVDEVLWGKLKEYQRAGVLNFLRLRGRMYLADDPG